MTPQRSRDLDWAGCLNVRDLGGLPLAPGGATRWEAVVRADRVSALTVDGWSALTAYGIRTVVDLRTDEERILAGTAGRPDGVRFVDASIFIEADPAWMERMFATTVSTRHHYRHVLTGCSGTFAGAIDAIARAPDGGVVVHCHAGRDRTGLLCAMLLDLVGVSRELIAEDYALSEARLDDIFPCHPETMLWSLDLLDASFGGVEGYLRSGGIAPDALAAVRARLAA